MFLNSYITIFQGGKYKMVNDTISDILTRIRNANLIKSQTVFIPLTRITKQISEILEKQGFIESFQIIPLSLNSKFNNLNSLKVSQEKIIGSEKAFTRKLKNTTLHKERQKLQQPSSDSKLSDSLKDKKNQNASRLGIILYLKYQGHDKKPCITNLKRISKPGLRIYATHKEIPKVLGGMGIAILSTSKGIMTDREARFHKIGGEILCSIW